MPGREVRRCVGKAVGVVVGVVELAVEAVEKAIRHPKFQRYLHVVPTS
jgi:hypothetical protein